MKAVKKILILLLMILPLFTSCADLGAGGLEEDYLDYFSSVILMSPDGKTEEKMSTFYETIELENSGTMKDVVDYDDYRLIAFEVADGYTLTVGEFAFFLRTKEKAAHLSFEFYVSNELPDSVGGNEETTPPDDGENPSDPELTEEDVFGDLDSYHADTFSIDTEWDSTYLAFEEEQTVHAGQYIVVRIIENRCTCGAETPEPAVPFTFNYLLFYITKVEND